MGLSPPSKQPERSQQTSQNRTDCMSRTQRRLLPIFLLTVASCAPVSSARRLPSNIAVAAADPARREQAALDAKRHGPEILAFAGTKPGAKVVDLIPGGGYWTRLFSRSVGPEGHVYGIWPDEYAKDDPELPGPYSRLIASYNNVSVLYQPAAAFKTPESVDLIFTAQNYHDYLNNFMGPVQPAVLNAAVFSSLKHGGVYLIIDHAATAGSGARDTELLHRIDPAIVKAQVLAAGFRFEGESRLLANPADDHSTSSLSTPIRGRTDQFIYKFRKP